MNAEGQSAMGPELDPGGGGGLAIWEKTFGAATHCFSGGTRLRETRLIQDVDLLNS